MARDRKDLGARKFVRVDLQKPGFLIPAPNAPWIECYILDISDNGACLDVGDLAVPKVFGLSLTASGEVRRVCTLINSLIELKSAERSSADRRTMVRVSDMPGVMIGRLANFDSPDKPCAAAGVNTP